MLKSNAFFIAFRIFNLRDHHINRIDICSRSNFWNHNQIQPFASLLNNVYHIAIHVMRV